MADLRDKLSKISRGPRPFKFPGSAPGSRNPKIVSTQIIMLGDYHVVGKVCGLQNIHYLLGTEA